MKELKFRQIHLDFHTNETIMDIAKEFNAETFAKTFKDANVDSVCCFARCHHGMIYYDTEKYKEAKHPNLKINLLSEQVDALHKYGIKAPIYITGGYDEFSAKKHPEWLQRDIEDKPLRGNFAIPRWKLLCFNSPYIDFIVEHTIEVMKMFDGRLDGLFFDIIKQHNCTCKKCIDDMLKEGLDPFIEDDRYTFSLKIINEFKSRLSGEIRKINKDCTIFYNVGLGYLSSQIKTSIENYSHLEIESLPTGGWGYGHFPLTAGYVKNLGYEYLMMTSRFHRSWADFGGFKTKEALEYECFRGLAYGAKCSIGDQMHPSGTLSKEAYKIIGEVYKSVEQKEEWCKNVSSLGEIGLLAPEILTDEQERLGFESLKGAISMLSEGHYQFDILDEESDFSKYRLIILADEILINKVLEEKIAHYLNTGGKAIISYNSGLSKDQKSFASFIDLSFLSESEYTNDYILCDKSTFKSIPEESIVMYLRGLNVKSNSENIKGVALSIDPYFQRNYKHFCSHSQTPPYKENNRSSIFANEDYAYFAHPIFTIYKKFGMKLHKNMVIDLIEKLLGRSLIKTNAPSTAEIIYGAQKDNKRNILHILHYLPQRRADNIDLLEDVIPLYNISFNISSKIKPEKVYSALNKQQLIFSYNNNELQFIVPKVEGHEIIVVEY